MGSFYQTTEPRFVENAIYKPDFQKEAGLVNLRIQKDALNKQLVSLGDSFQELNIETFAEFQPQAQEIMQPYSEQLQTAIGDISKDPNNQRTQQAFDETIRNLRKEFTTGDIGKMRNAYRAYAETKQQYEENIKKAKNEEHKRAAQQHLKEWEANISRQVQEGYTPDFSISGLAEGVHGQEYLKSAIDPENLKSDITQIVRGQFGDVQIEQLSVQQIQFLQDHIKQIAEVELMGNTSWVQMMADKYEWNMTAEDKANTSLQEYITEQAEYEAELYAAKHSGLTYKETSKVVTDQAALENVRQRNRERMHNVRQRNRERMHEIKYPQDVEMANVVGLQRYNQKEIEENINNYFSILNKISLKKALSPEEYKTYNDYQKVVTGLDESTRNILISLADHTPETFETLSPEEQKELMEKEYSRLLMYASVTGEFSSTSSFPKRNLWGWIKSTPNYENTVEFASEEANALLVETMGKYEEALEEYKTSSTDLIAQYQGNSMINESFIPYGQNNTLGRNTDQHANVVVGDLENTIIFPGNESWRIAGSLNIKEPAMGKGKTKDIVQNIYSVLSPDSPQTLEALAESGHFTIQTTYDIGNAVVVRITPVTEEANKVLPKGYETGFIIYKEGVISNIRDITPQSIIANDQFMKQNILYRSLDNKLGNTIRKQDVGTSITLGETFNGYTINYATEKIDNNQYRLKDFTVISPSGEKFDFSQYAGYENKNYLSYDDLIAQVYARISHQYQRINQ